MEAHANSSEIANNIIKDSVGIQRILTASVFLQLEKLNSSDVIRGFSRTEAGDIHHGDFQQILSMNRRCVRRKGHVVAYGSGHVPKAIGSSRLLARANILCRKLTFNVNCFVS
jgi:hypothetical protein